MLIRKILKGAGYALLILFVLFCILPYLVPARDFPLFDAKKPYKESLFAEVKGVKLHYRLLETRDSLRGNVLLVHGFSGSTFSWRKNTDSLQKSGYRILLVDLPAYGYSDRASGIDHSTQNRAELLWALIDQLGYGSLEWQLAGHSMGAGVVVQMAKMRENKTGNIVLVDGLAFGRRRGLGWRGGLLYFPPVRRWVQIIAENFYYNEAYFQKLLGLAYSRPAKPEDAQGYLAPFHLKGTTQAVLDSFLAAPKMDTSHNQKLTDRTFLIWGKKDEWVKFAFGEKYAQQNNRPLYTITEAGHNPMETHPSEFNAAFLNFLRKK